MKQVISGPAFLKGWKSLLKKRYSQDELDKVVEILSCEGSLPGKYKDHALNGKYKGYRECHIRDNWLLIYRITDSEVILLATGTHDDLFK